MRPQNVVEIASLVCGVIMAAVCFGCAGPVLPTPPKKMEVHYVHNHICQTWSDASDDPNANEHGIGPLLVFAIPKIVNTSAAGNPPAVFQLPKVYYNGSNRDTAEFLNAAPQLLSPAFHVPLSPGQTAFPPGGGRFAIQLNGDTASPTQEFLLLYDSASDEAVIMMRDSSSPQVHAFCGTTMLSGF